MVKPNAKRPSPAADITTARRLISELVERRAENKAQAKDIDRLNRQISGLLRENRTLADRLKMRPAAAKKAPAKKVAR